MVAIERQVAADPVVTEWRALLARHALAWGALEHELGGKHDLGASEFEVLDRLAEALDRCAPDGTGGKRKFRVQELAAAVHLSQSALSRLIARLERAGLVERALCAEDRRGIFVHITEEGRARHAAALPTHRAVLARILSSAPDSGGHPLDDKR